MSSSSTGTMIRDMTEGPVVPQLLRFAFPLFVSNALQAFYNLIDMVIVGNYIGKAGMSAVSIKTATPTYVTSRSGSNLNTNLSFSARTTKYQNA